MLVPTLNNKPHLPSEAFITRCGYGFKVFLPRNRILFQAVGTASPRLILFLYSFRVSNGQRDKTYKSIAHRFERTNIPRETNVLYTLAGQLLTIAVLQQFGESERKSRYMTTV